MQFPYPRKSSEPNGYGSARSTSLRNKRWLRQYGPGVACVTAVMWLLARLVGRRGDTTSDVAAGAAARVVIVTTINHTLPEKFIAAIKDNRRDYAQRHRYATFFPNVTDYDLMEKTPASWSTIPSLRHAMTLHPRAQWLWYLSASALIMNPHESLQAKLLDPRKLEGLMIGDHAVVPPDSVIRTVSHLAGARADLVLTQDRDGLAGGSLLVRTGEWAKFFLDAWYDPLYRSYNFQKAEAHALEHIVQWHGTILAKLALVPQRVLNSYTKEANASTAEGLYQEGDFVANFHGCQRDPARNCEQEMGPLMARWKELRDQERK